MFRRFFLALLAKLYISGVKIRHFLYNGEFIKSRCFDIPVICVGNITVGGTGKTPMCEMLVEHFLQQGGVALLSRGYGRKSRGYREVDVEDDYRNVGDEPLQMKMKYPEALVVVCEKRVEAVVRIMKQHPEVKIVIMDDGFQHRRITPAINIVMIDYSRPFYEDHPLPHGSLRDTPDELHRADYFVVTKCPQVISPLEMSLFRGELQVVADGIETHFTRINNSSPQPVFEIEDVAEFGKEQQIIALAGIGNPAPFIEMIECNYTLVDKLIYADHHSFSSGDIAHIAKALEKHPSAVVLTTEKDKVKLFRGRELPAELKRRLYYSPIKMEFVSSSQSDLLKKIDRDVRQY